MPDTAELRLEILRNVYHKIKGNKILDAGAKALLQEVPVVGNFLVNLYENASGDDESKASQVLTILENLQKFNQQQYEELKRIIEDSGNQIKESKESLGKLLIITNLVVNKLDEISSLIHELRVLAVTDTDRVMEKITRLEHNLLEEIGKLNVSGFDYDMPSERLLFYLKLKYFLDNSGTIYSEQNAMARDLARRIANRGNVVTIKQKGLDHYLYYMHKHDMMNQEDLKIFSNIKRVTDDTVKFNSYARELIMKNKKFLQDTPLLNDLLIHYGIWQAKYQLLKDDKHMCIIYAGPDQGAYFPGGLDEQIKSGVDELRIQTKLDANMLSL